MKNTEKFIDLVVITHIVVRCESPEAHTMFSSSNEFIGDKESMEYDSGGESLWSSINKVLKLVENWPQFDLKLRKSNGKLWINLSNCISEHRDREEIFLVKDKSEKLSNSAKKTKHRPPSYKRRAWLRKKSPNSLKIN